MAGVSTFCSSGSSAFTASFNFTTVAPTCNVPSGMTTASVTTTSATLSWTTVTGAVSYTVNYRITGSASWNSISTSTTSVVLNNLTPSSNYEWQVSTVCSAGASAFSSSANFTTGTAPACDIPSGLISSSVTTNSATLTWTAVTNASSYSVRYRITGASTWTTTSASTNSLQLNALASSTSYEWQVSSVCLFWKFCLFIICKFHYRFSGKAAECQHHCQLLRSLQIQRR